MKAAARALGAGLALGLAACSGSSGAPGADAGPTADAGRDAGSKDGGGGAGGGGSPSPCSGEAVITRAIRYASTDEKNVFDLYAPSRGGPCPLVLWIHGGAWETDAMLVGDSADKVLPIVDRGYAVAALRFRLSGDAPFPAEIQDVKAATRYLHAHAGELGLDDQRFAAWGVSSGAHLGSLLTLTEGVAALEDLTQGSPDSPAHVDALVACYGPTYLPDMDAAILANGCPPALAYHHEPSSPESRFLGCTQGLDTSCPQAVTADPVTYVKPGGQPVMLSHGLADCTVPWEQTERLADALAAAHVPSSFTKVPGGNHDVGSCPETAAIEAFIDAALF